MSDTPIFLGFDFGTESVRVVAVDARGAELGSHASRYAHAQIVRGSAPARDLFDADLPPAFALQHPDDWLASAADACRRACARLDPASVRGIGVDFTSCTVLPCRASGSPLCLDASDHPADFARDPHAWPKLWKHHGAVAQTERINALARRTNQPWLARYGGSVGLEWLWPKVLEVLEQAPDVAAAADLWLEAGDWFVWQLVGAPAAQGDVTPDRLPRSTCQAGYKGLWSPDQGWPDAEFLARLADDLPGVRAGKLPGRFVAPGQRAGDLCPHMAERLGLPAGIPVSAAIIDAHAGVPGAGVGSPDVMVLVMGTSGCHMLMSAHERDVPGVAGVVPDGILPGLVGYETGQAAMGDAFDFVRRLTGQRDFADLDRHAADVEPGAEGLLCVDWFNGCRTPLMDGALTGGFLGMSLNHEPAHAYRAALEASACGLRWIVETLRDADVPVRHLVATGGLPNHNPLFIKIVASVLDEPVAIHASAQGPALGAAILGALAADHFPSTEDAVAHMAGPASSLPPPSVVQPTPEWIDPYHAVYQRYRKATAAWPTVG